MITETIFKDLLIYLGFTKTGSIYEKKYQNLGISMSVDFQKKILIYPDTIIGGDRNTGFNAPENFVVFECVNRLLDKGYRPEHIELEKVWTMGHTQKSGRADICVSDNNGSTLFIIECKTSGKEYNKALTDTKNDGAQLFSYWTQEQSCKWLVLYTSDYKDNKVEYKAPTINCSDDANIILLAEKDKTIKLYRDAHTTPERYEVWKETYSNQIHDDLIFSVDSVAYNIGVKPLLKKDLKDFTAEDGIVNKFEEILRHNNVSDKENAFNRLIALFICKLVDESTKNDNDEVDFQYKQGTDTYETLQDRLQRLHQEGMEKFMREKIYYVSADYPEWLFSNYTGTQRKNAIEDLQKTIRILKFYSNNDFAFKDVHNEELFYQNGKILVEMVQLFEKYRIVYPSKHQFLGDLFEQLLNKGFKQNEGQFFTPMPITRFIWDSLPIERMVKSEKGTSYPKVIDYACGAGHFLTEAVEAINYFANFTNNDWVRDHIFGIEKDYRLARVAKISLFMNGAGEGNIVFGDGLENAPDKNIENGIFDILVANPPYSVKDFKQHLQLKNNSFKLLDRIGLNGGEIETLFVERIGQLLKPKGIAAVILPSSILSNDTASYIGAREQLLQNFYIHAIVAFGDKTFGATGTNTVVLFLEKFNEPPKNTDLSADSIDAIFNNSNLIDWKDKEILSNYVAQIGVPEQTYSDFINKKYSANELSKMEYFEMYKKAFDNSSDIKNLKKKKTFQNKTTDEQNTELLEKLYSYILSIEKEKLFYFSLIYEQKTVIIQAPTDNKEQKQFLGYDWSNRKGNEGIQIITPGGKLYNDSDRTANDTLASTIRQSFNNIIPIFTADNLDFGFVIDTKDLLDYSRTSFSKSISLTGSKKIEYTSKFKMTQLQNIAEVTKGSSITEAEAIPGNYKVVAGGTDYAYMHNKYNREANIITVSASGSAGFVNYWNERIFASDCSTIKAISDITTKWIYYYLKMLQPQIQKNLRKGSNPPHVYADDLKLIPIPDIDITIQKQIVDDCKKIESQCKKAEETIKNNSKEIEDKFLNLDLQAKSENTFTLASEDKFDVFTGNRILTKELIKNGKIPVYSANVFEPFGYVDKYLITDFSRDSVVWGIDGDWQVNFIPKNNEFYPTDHCGVLRCKTPNINPRYLAHILKVKGKEMNFTRNFRPSIERVKGITFTTPDINEQNKVIAKIEELEKEIVNCKTTIANLQNKTTEILNKYLQ